LDGFQNGQSVPISYEALHSLRLCNRLRKVAGNLYLFDGALPSFQNTPESFGDSSDSPRQFFLLNIENPTNLRCHSLPINEILCLFRHKGLFKECRSSVFRRFRQIYASESSSEELLESSGSLIVCLAQVGVALFPGKPGARMALRLIRKFHEGMAISKGNLLLVQQILLLQAKSSHFDSVQSNDTKNMLNLQHARVLSSIYPFPPSPPPTGKKPEVYFKELDDPNEIRRLKNSLSEGGYAQAITSVNDRTFVRKVCQDSHVDPFAAYIVAMAWGGRDMGNFRYTLDCQAQIVTLIAKLRKSGNSRDYDFDKVQAAAKSIKGLGISFYTKLLYFFRPMSDAYILDKWTAMACYILFVPQPIRLVKRPDKSGHRAPEIDTTGQEYEKFCAEIDQLSGFLWPGLSIAGDVAEMAMFGVPPIPGNNSKQWRKHIESNFPSPSPPQAKSKGTSKASSNAFLAQLYRAHMTSGQKLPAPMGLISKPALVTPWSAGGVRWVYDPAGMHVRVFKYYKSGTGIQTYQKDLSQTTVLQNLAQANGWQFITIKGASPGLGFKIPGNTTPRGGSHQIIAKCLQAMEILFATIP